MPKRTIRITLIDKPLEDLMARGDISAMRKWLELTIEDLEYRLRYTKREETQLIQGALRALDDIKEVLQ